MYDFYHPLSFLRPVVYLLTSGTNCLYTYCTEHLRSKHLLYEWAGDEYFLMIGCYPRTVSSILPQTAKKSMLSSVSLSLRFHGHDACAHTCTQSSEARWKSETEIILFSLRWSTVRWRNLWSLGQKMDSLIYLISDVLRWSRPVHVCLIYFFLNEIYVQMVIQMFPSNRLCWRTMLQQLLRASHNTFTHGDGHWYRHLWLRPDNLT